MTPELLKEVKVDLYEKHIRKVISFQKCFKDKAIRDLCMVA